MSKLRSYIWLLVTMLFAVCLVACSLENLVLKPAHVISELGGDAAKNSFTYLYHSMHGHGYWFDGMNYPYGEHIVYTDGQPVLSVLLASIKGITLSQALLVLWWLIGLSYVLSILYVYKILLHFKVAPFMAMVFAGIICMMTPQILRLQGHYALAYTCIIPMLFYWTIRYNEQFHWRYCLYFFISGCIMAFLHPYYAAMMLVWVVFYLLGYFIFSKEAMSLKLKHSLWLFTSVLMVLGVVGIVMKITDPVPDRPVTPFNTLYETCTRIKQVITSIHSPVWRPFVGTNKSYLISDGGEGYAYIGIVVGVTLGLCIVMSAVKSFRQKRIDITAGQTGFSPIWLLMALGTLLFGMGIPFKWHMEGLIQHMSLFKQFRSLGRFSWIFYYIAGVYTAVVLYHYYAGMKAKKKFFTGFVVLFLAAGLWSFEATGYIKYARYLSKKALYNYDMMFSVHEQSWQSFLQEQHFSGSDFQAILMVPFFHVGTEKLWVGNPDWLMTLSGKAALQLNLPIVDVMMSRSSWSQAQKQVKITAGPFADKPILQDIKSRKPFLLLHFDGDSLNADQKYLLQASDYIGHYSQCFVYACYPGRIGANDRRYGDSVAHILSYMQQQDTVIANNGTFYIEHFDKNTNEQRLFGAGGGAVTDKDSAVIANIPITPPKDSQKYEFSCWFLLGKEDYRSPYVTLQLIDEAGKIDTAYDALTRQSTDNEGMWFRASRYFYVQHNTRSIRCVLVNIPRPAYIAIDELMLRTEQTLIISKAGDGKVMVNNHLFKKIK